MPDERIVVRPPDGIVRLINEPTMLGDLWGPDGNAWAITGNVVAAIKAAGYSKDVVQKYNDAAFSGDYVNLLEVTDRTVECFWLDGMTVRPLRDYINQYKARDERSD